MVWIQISIVYKLSFLYPTGDALHSVSPHHVEKGIHEEIGVAQEGLVHLLLSSGLNLIEGSLE